MPVQRAFSLERGRAQRRRPDHRQHRADARHLGRRAAGRRSSATRSPMARRSSSRPTWASIGSSEQGRMHDWSTAAATVDFRTPASALGGAEPAGPRHAIPARARATTAVRPGVGQRSAPARADRSRHAVRRDLRSGLQRQQRQHECLPERRHARPLTDSSNRPRLAARPGDARDLALQVERHEQAIRCLSEPTVEVSGLNNASVGRCGAGYRAATSSCNGRRHHRPAIERQRRDRRHLVPTVMRGNAVAMRRPGIRASFNVDDDERPPRWLRRIRLQCRSPVHKALAAKRDDGQVAHWPFYLTKTPTYSLTCWILNTTSSW